MEFFALQKEVQYKLNHIQKSWHCKQCCTHQHQYTVCQSFPPCKGQQNMTGDQPRQNSAKYRYVIVCFKLDWDHAVCMCTRTLKHSLHVVLPLATLLSSPYLLYVPRRKTYRYFYHIYVILHGVKSSTWRHNLDLKCGRRGEKVENFSSVTSHPLSLLLTLKKVGDQITDLSSCVQS